MSLSTTQIGMWQIRERQVSAIRKFHKENYNLTKGQIYQGVPQNPLKTLSLRDSI